MKKKVFKRLGKHLWKHKAKYAYPAMFGAGYVTGAKEALMVSHYPQRKRLDRMDKKMNTLIRRNNNNKQ